MNLVRACRNNSRAVFLAHRRALTLADSSHYFNFPATSIPELNFPRIVVLVHAGDLSPDTMLLTVTRPIEEQVSTVLGVPARPFADDPWRRRDFCLFRRQHGHAAGAATGAGASQRGEGVAAGGD